MLYTPNYGFIKPEATDPADGAGQITTLATAVDTELDALQTQVDGKSATSHNHDTTYAKGILAYASGLSAVSNGSTDTTGVTNSITTYSGRRYLIFWNGTFTLENSGGAEDPTLASYAEVTLQKVVSGSTVFNLDTISVGTIGTYTASRRSWSATTLITSTTASTTFRLAINRPSGQFGSCEILSCKIQVLDVNN